MREGMSTRKHIKVASIGVSFVLAIALAGQAFLPWVDASPNWYDWTLATVAAISGIGMLVRVASVLRQRQASSFQIRIGEEAAWLSVGVWVASIAEILPLLGDIRTATVIRNSAFYSAFGIASLVLYVMEAGDRRVPAKVW